MQTVEKRHSIAGQPYQVLAAWIEGSGRENNWSVRSINSRSIGNREQY